MNDDGITTEFFSSPAAYLGIRVDEFVSDTNNEKLLLLWQIQIKPSYPRLRLHHHQVNSRVQCS